MAATDDVTAAADLRQLRRLITSMARIAQSVVTEPSQPTARLGLIGVLGEGANRLTGADLCMRANRAERQASDIPWARADD